MWYDVRDCPLSTRRMCSLEHADSNVEQRYRCYSLVIDFVEVQEVSGNVTMMLRQLACLVEEG